jgi:hypothetical protein
VTSTAKTSMYHGTADMMRIVPRAPGLCLLVMLATHCRLGLAYQLNLHASKTSCTAVKHICTLLEAGSCTSEGRRAHVWPQAVRLMLAGF